MSERQKRLREVYDYLREHYGIHTQGDFAKAIGYNRAVISSALNGNEANLTDSLFENIIIKYADVFNPEYLMSGSGGLLDEKEMAINRRKEELSAPIDQDKAIKLLINSMQNQIDDLHARLKERDEYIEFLKKQVSKYEFGDIRNLNANLFTNEPVMDPTPDPIAK
jgi:peptidoglycan hydrolase CwlO-like protein